MVFMAPQEQKRGQQIIKPTTQLVPIQLLGIYLVNWYIFRYLVAIQRPGLLQIVIKNMVQKKILQHCPCKFYDSVLYINNQGTSLYPFSFVCQLIFHIHNLRLTLTFQTFFYFLSHTTFTKFKKINLKRKNWLHISDHQNFQIILGLKLMFLA